MTTLVQQGKDASESGLSVKDMAHAIKLKKHLEANGVSLDLLPVLVKLAEKYGDALKVLAAVAAYGGLKGIEDETHAADKKRQHAIAQAAAADQKLQETEGKLAKLQKPLKAYDDVQKLGFGETEFGSLAELTNRFGGPGAVFKAVKMYANLTELTGKISAAKAKRDALNAENSKLETVNSHLATAVCMCNKLISQYNLGLDGIATLLTVAGKYGEPLKILKALEAYGSLQALADKQAKLDGNIAKREELAAQLEGKNQAALAQLEALNALAAKVGARVGEIEAKFEADETLRRIAQLIVDPKAADYDEHSLVALTIARALGRWVSANENKFKLAKSIKTGLADLIKELGGI